MTPRDLTLILHYHRNISGLKPNHKSLGWNSASSQRKRFEVLTQIGNMHGCEVMDLGCGYGDFRPFLAEKFTNTIYYGVDCMTSFLEIAHRRYGDLPNTYFYQGDFSTMAFPEVDYMICCGAFNYNRQEEDLHFPTIAKMLRVAKKGVAFNMLDASVFTKQGALQGHNLDRVMSYCESLTENIELIQGYAKEDFTVFLYPSTQSS